MTDAPSVSLDNPTLLTPSTIVPGRGVIEWPVPTRAGHYWAQQIAVSPGTADEAAFEPRSEWEVVWVYENSQERADPDYLRVFVLGVERTQCLKNFNWGPPVALDIDFWLTPKATMMVHGFAAAMGDKLARAQAKHGYADNWAAAGWQGDLITQLLDHVRKGDPIDVAAYCAFAWAHGWSIAPVVPVVSGGVYVEAQKQQADFAAELAVARARRSERQQQVYDWAFRCFGMAHATDPRQRGLRMLEEAIELYQATDGDQAKAHQLVDFIFTRPKGEIGQELGGLGVTLLALAAAVGKDADAEEATEVARILSKSPEHFAARNAAKNAAGFDVTAPEGAA